MNYDDPTFITIFECERALIFTFCIALYFLNNSNKRVDLARVYPLIIAFFCHIIVLTINGDFFYSSITILILTIIFLIVFTPEIEFIIKFLSGVISLSFLFYFATIQGFIEVVIYSIILQSFLTLFFYEPVYRLLYSYFHSIQLCFLKGASSNSHLKKILFWQSKITITQVALEHESDNKKYQYDYYESWIKDLLGNNSVYGIEVKCHNDFKFSFFFNSHSEKLAIKRGQTLKAELQVKYRGLDAEINIIPMTRNELFSVNHDYFYEIKLPRPPYIEKIKIIQSFINAFRTTSEDINLYILWKKGRKKKIIRIREKANFLEYRDKEERMNFSRMWQDELQKVKIFVSFKNVPLEKNRKNMIEGILESLAIAGRNDKRPAKLKRVRKGVFIDIYTLNFYFGQYITSYLLDFDLAKELPIPKKFIYELQSFDLKKIPKGDPSEIIIGNHIMDGIVSEKKATISTESLRRSVLMIGKPDTGKTYLIGVILNHFIKYNLNVGILIINLAKGKQSELYPSDYCLDWGDERLHIPYAVFNDNFLRCLFEISECLVYSLGLKNVVVDAIYNTLLLYYNTYFKVPKHIKHLFSELLRYLDKNPYDTRLQMRLVQAIKHRYTQLFSTPLINYALRTEDKIPKWFEDVVYNGRKVMINLAGCKPTEKRLLATLILQMFRALIPDKEQDTLKQIIVLDEAHQLTEEPKNVNPEDDDYIAMDSFRKIFSQLIREFRSKGVGHILADQTSVGLYESVINIPCLFFLFQQSIASTQNFTNDLKEQELISRLDKRICMAKDGSYSYLFKTEDFVYKRKKRKELSYDNFFAKTD